MFHNMDATRLLLPLALDLTRSLATEDRYRRLLAVVRRLLPCDAACLLRVDGTALVPLAAHGLLPEALAHRYERAEHPRLEVIAEAREPIRFPVDSALRDPFDGLLARDPSGLAHVHACLGCPLRVEEELVGVLTIDALQPGAFDDVSSEVLAWLAALAGAALHTSRLIDALEASAVRLGRVAADLMRSAEQRSGAGLIGASTAMQRLRQEIDLVAPSDLVVLVTGETGVGKELVVRAIHAGSRRADQALLYVNCAALPETIAESELFGHVKGAFTGADQARAGKFEVADGGTLFLDEVAELSLPIQAKLLRALQEGEIQRVGADRPLAVDVRVIAATHRDLREAIAAGRFRADLFHRLNVYPLHVPPLRERRSDVPRLAAHFCDAARAKLGVGPVRLTPQAQARLTAYPWPGNVRELENVLFRVVLQASARVPRGAAVTVDAPDLPAEFADGHAAAAEEATTTEPRATPVRPLREAVDDYQRRLIRDAVAAHDGNWAAAARALGLHRSNLHHLATRLGLR